MNFKGNSRAVQLHARRLLSAEDWQQLIWFGKAHGWSTLLCHNHTYPRPPVCKYIKVKRSWLVINLHCHAYVVSIAIRPSHQYPSVNLDQYAGLFLLCICIPLQHKKRSMHWSSGNPVFPEIRVWVHLIDKNNTVWLATNCKKINHKRQYFMLVLTDYL